MSIVSRVSVRWYFIILIHCSSEESGILIFGLSTQLLLISYILLHIPYLLYPIYTPITIFISLLIYTLFIHLFQTAYTLLHIPYHSPHNLYTYKYLHIPYHLHPIYTPITDILHPSTHPFSFTSYLNLHIPKNLYLLRIHTHKHTDNLNAIYTPITHTSFFLLHFFHSHCLHPIFTSQQKSLLALHAHRHKHPYLFYPIYRLVHIF